MNEADCYVFKAKDGSGIFVSRHLKPDFVANATQEQINNQWDIYPVYFNNLPKDRLYPQRVYTYDEVKEIKIQTAKEIFTILEGNFTHDRKQDLLIITPLFYNNLKKQFLKEK